jgi:hypothetical protein
MSDEAGNYAIYAVSEPPHKESGLLRRLLWPEGRQHSFLMLVEEMAGGGKKPLAELHFSGKDSDGKFVNAGSKPFNLIAGVADILGLETPFRAVASWTGLGKRLYPIKAVKVSARSDFGSLVKFGGVSGAPERILQRWNRACAAAVIINRANIPFTAQGSKGRGPVNCHSGTKTLLGILGDEFSHVSAAIGHKKGRDLSCEVPSLARLKMLSPPQVARISLASLEHAQECLARKLYQTSRILPKQDAPSPGNAPASP